MVAIRYVALVALVIWLGGMIALALLVAPSTFRILQAQDPASGRQLAGALFGAILRQFYLIGYVCGGIVLLSLITMKLIGPPPRAFPLRAAIVTVMLAVSLYAGIPVSRQIAAVQAQVSGPVSRLPDADPRRVRFDRLHAMSTLLMTINMGLGLVLLFWYARE